MGLRRACPMLRLPHSFFTKSGMMAETGLLPRSGIFMRKALGSYESTMAKQLTASERTLER